jgi:prepilin peptidase CpaA
MPMTVEIIRTFLLLVLAGLLIRAAHMDIIAYRIPNKICLAIALLAPAYWYVEARMGTMDPKANAVYHLMIAGCVFVFFFINFALGWMGGGDVKLLGAIALWTPLPDLFQWLVFMSIAGALMAALFWYMRKIRKQRRRFYHLRYGVAIALGGVAFVSQPFLKTLTLT